MVQLNFNARQYEPSTGAQDVFETGVYSVQIVSSEVKPTKAGNGHMLVFGLSCLDAGFAGRRITARLNVHNPNPQAVEIAYRELSAISHVVGVLDWQDTQQLHGRPFKVSIEKVERNDKPGTFSNDIKGYLDYAGNPPTGAGGPAAGASQPPVAPPTAPAPQPPVAPAPTPPVAAPAPAPAPVAAAAPVAAPVPTPAPAPVAAPPFQPPQAAPAPQTPTPPFNQIGAAPGAPAPWQAAPDQTPAPGPVPPWQQQ